MARQDAAGPADRGVLRNNGDLGLTDFWLALGLGRLRLDQQCRERGTHRGGSSEDVERDLEAMGECSAAERTEARAIAAIECRDEQSPRP